MDTVIKSFDNGPIVMGILNCTTDSFFEKSRVQTVENAVHEAKKMLLEGATWIDVGGYSTRPGAEQISETEERNRVLPVISALVHEIPSILISIDTFRAKVATEAVKAGARMVNDVSGGTIDQQMYPCVAEMGVPYVLMHMRGTPHTMHEHTDYKDVVTEVIQELGKKTEHLHNLGMDQIILDPGFGFAKTLDHNYEILKKLASFKVLKYPLMVGISRKSMIYKTLNTTPDEALIGTTAAHMAALLGGAHILRVHDVLAAKQTIAVFNKLKN